MPVVAMVDARLAERQTDGWHYDDMPPDGEAWRESLSDLDADAELRCGTGFAAASWQDRTAIVQAVQDLGTDRWHRLAAGHVWSLWTRYACTAFYSHPWAWKEIGFAGPAYPRGYKNLGVDRREPFEVRDAHPGRRPGQGRQPMSGTGAVRDRNESAWLLPATARANGTGSGEDMRRFADDDEVDLVVVGCGAGGSTLLQRLARAGWRVVALDAGPFWDPETRLGQRRGRLAPPLLDRAPGHLRRTTRCRSAPTTPAAASAGRWSTTPATPRASTPATSTPAASDGVGADWPIDYADLRPYYADHRGASCPSPARTGRGATRTPTRTGRTRSAATARSSCAAPRRSASPAKVGPVAIANGRFGNRPHCIYRGFCLQGCKVNAKASPLITHIPDALGPRRRGPRRLDGHPGRGRRAHRPRHRGALRARRRRALPAGPDGRDRRLLDRDARGCCSTPTSPRFPDGLCNDFDQVGRYLMVQGAPQTAGRFDAEVRMYKAPPPEVSTEAVLRDRPDASPTSAASPSRPSRRCRSPGPSTSPPRATGAPRCAST